MSRDPLICPKEHTFCASCIRSHMAQKRPECPECKIPLKPEDLLPAPRILRNMLSELRISCANKSLGCGSVVALEHLASHEKTCPFSEQPCKFCRKTYPSQLLDPHELKCEDRSVACSKGCGLRVFPNKVCLHLACVYRFLSLLKKHDVSPRTYPVLHVDAPVLRCPSTTASRPSSSKSPI